MLSSRKKFVKKYLYDEETNTLTLNPEYRITSVNKQLKKKPIITKQSTDEPKPKKLEMKEEGKDEDCQRLGKYRYKKELLKEGRSGKIFEVGRVGKKGFPMILKRQDLANEKEILRAEYEVNIQIRVYEAHNPIVKTPRIFDHWICRARSPDKEGFYARQYIVMERWFGNLDSLLHNQFLEYPGSDAFLSDDRYHHFYLLTQSQLDQVVVIAEELSRMGVVHGDFNANNIFYRFNPKSGAFEMGVADFGYATEFVQGSKPQFLKQMCETGCVWNGDLPIELNQETEESRSWIWKHRFKLNLFQWETDLTWFMTKSDPPSKKKSSSSSSDKEDESSSSTTEREMVSFVVPSLHGPKLNKRHIFHGFLHDKELQEMKHKDSFTQSEWLKWQQFIQNQFYMSKTRKKK